MDAQTTVQQLGEFGLVAEVTALAGGGGKVLIGPGDDAAHVAVRTGGYLVSTDLLIEDRHFRRDWSSAYEVGRKAAACNLSDIAAMGGVADALTVGLGVPGDLPAQWALDLARGVVDECKSVGAHLVGGDVTASEAIVVSVTAIGEATRPVRRDGARPGDVVAFAGNLGLAGAGFAALSRGFRSPRAAVESHRVPAPPYAAGPQAALAGATAMVDVSDGLLADLGHVATASEVAIDLDPALLPVAEPVSTVAEALGLDPLTLVLTGGDDYALVATFPEGTELPSGWTRIGAVAEGAGVTVAGEPWEGSPGHRHFA